MFGVKKEDLIRGLCRVSCKLCGYLGTMCDCKYMDTNSEIFRQNSEQTGCPETAMAATLINAMTPEEFYSIAQRAGIHISLTQEDSIELHDLFKQMKKQRNELLRSGALVDNMFEVDDE